VIDRVAMFGAQWLESLRHVAALGRGSMAVAAVFWDPRRLRSRWLADLSQAMDAYLRSPAFLDLMDHNFKGMIRSAHLTCSTSLSHTRRFR
jgi:hypothetical protein